MWKMNVLVSDVHVLLIICWKS